MSALVPRSTEYLHIRYQDKGPLFHLHSERAGIAAGRLLLIIRIAPLGDHQHRRLMVDTGFVRVALKGQNAVNDLYKDINTHQALRGVQCGEPFKWLFQ